MSNLDSKSIRSTARAQIAVAITAAVLLTACTGASEDEPLATGTSVSENSETAASSTSSGTEVEADSAAIEATVVSRPTNSLIATVDVVSNADMPMDLLIEAEGVAARTITAAESASTHTFNVVGLRAETTYQFTASSPDTNSPAETVEFTTGELPPSAPTVEITQAAATLDTAGITFVGLRDTEDGDPAYFGFDGEGEVVWYLDSEERLGGDPYIRHVGNDEVLVMFRDLIQRLSLDGEVLEEWNVSNINDWHHDVRLLEDGGLLLLTREQMTNNGQEISGDVITEIDSDGVVVWEWSTFDHLDTSRFPGELSTAEAHSGGVDWTHANSLWVDEESAEIVISLRSQGWVVNVNWSSGAINWIAGDSAGISADFEADFLSLESGTWATGQHGAMVTESGELAVYDNRNESGGETDLSRAVVYTINAEAGTANQIFEASAGKYTTSLGDVDELANGNLLISAGGSGNGDRDGRIAEVNRSGGVVWEAVLPGISFYRSERITWADLSSQTEAGRLVVDGVEPANDPASTDEQGETEDEADATEEVAAGVTNITNAFLTKTDASCAAYAGDYSSQITDVSNDVPFDGSVTLRIDGDVCVLETNSIPNHDVGEGSSFANDIGEVSASYSLPINPQVADEPTAIGSDAAAAVLLNGVVWESYPAACFDFGEGGRLGQERIGCPGTVDHPWRYDIGSPLNDFGVDIYFAHPQGDGYYHYHKTPVALYDTACTGVSESPVIGFAKDGFPIFGPCFADEDGTVRNAVSSYGLQEGERQDVAEFTTPYIVGSVASTEYDGQFVGDYEFVEGSGDLDECNGMTVDGVYGYYLTNSYPYVLNCFSGTPTAEANFGRTQARNR